MSLDIEQFENNTKIVTEIGIAVYIPPEPLTSNNPNQFTNAILIVPDIRATHLIVEEDNRYNFSYGKSVYLSQHGCIALVEQVLRQSMGSQLGYNDAVKLNGRDANLVLVEHSVKGDINALTAVGVKFPKNYEILDTQYIW